MPSHEQPLLPQSPEEHAVKISYEMKDYLGRILATGDQFDLTNVPNEARYFDGYIESPLGNFAFDGEIRLAREILRNIQEYYLHVSELKKLELARPKAESKRNAAATAFQWDNKKEKMLVEADSEMRKIWSNIELEKRRVNELSQKLAPYRL
ncbi:MAG: hypothetical protein Q7R88_00255 [bacterium]|nr:hypothetical protein [bacterium]